MDSDMEHFTDKKQITSKKKEKVFIYPFLIHGTVCEDDNSVHLTRITL